ncbi:MAG: DUF1700 domain-containing protein [Pseudomonadota bacterium]
MKRADFIAALRLALEGLPPELVAKTVAYYEQRFIDGAAAGQPEVDIAADLGPPGKIAMTLRANTHLNAFEQNRRRGTLLRLPASILGLAIFNLFMVVPAAIGAAVLSALYIGAMAVYVAGIAITASGLSGANELVLDGPLRHVVINSDDGGRAARTRVTISEKGIHATQDIPDGDARRDQLDDELGGPVGDPAATVIRRAEQLAGGGIHVYTDLDNASRGTQSVFGLGLVLGGIALFLVCLALSQSALRAILRYMQMQLAVLRGER